MRKDEKIIDHYYINPSNIKVTPRSLFSTSHSEVFNDAVPNAHVVLDLGHLVDSKLSFNQHCFFTMKKLPRFVSFIFENFTTRNTAFLVKLYKCYVLPLSINAVSCIFL